MKPEHPKNAKHKDSNTTRSRECPICQIPGDKWCQGCQIVSYCSVDHQRLDWNKHKSMCCPFILKENEELGRYLIAARKLRSGEILLEESPLIGGPRVDEFCGQESQNEEIGVTKSRYKGQICLSCCKRICKVPGLCQKCNWPICGIKCSKAKEHAENECKHFVNNKIRYDPPSALPDNILYRGIIILRGILKSQTNPAVWTQILYLQHQRFDKSNISNMQPDTILKLKTLFKVQKLATDEVWNRINSTIEINAFSINRVEEENGDESSAIMLFHKASLIAHSCVPNCTQSIAYSPVFSMRIRASREIRKGEILTVSYNQQWNYYGNHRRSKLIIQTAGFTCKCERCLDQTELGTFTSAIKCTSGNCLGYLLPKNSSMPDNLWTCTTKDCHKIESGDLVNSRVELLEKELSELQIIYMTVPNGTLELFNEFIEKSTDKVLHRNHWILQQARRIIISIQGSNLKRLDCAELEKFIDHCTCLLSVFDILSPGISLERGLYQLQLSRALSLKLELSTEKYTIVEKATFLKTIYDLQCSALLYWKEDVQTKPLDKDVGFEAHNLQLAIVKNVSQMSGLC